MVIVIDTNVVSNLSCRVECHEVVELLRRSGAFLTVPETIVEEVIRTSDPLVRAKLSRTLVDLLDDCPVLAHLWNQLTWGGQRFLCGEIAFKPFTAVGTDSLKTHLRNGDTLRPCALEQLQEKKNKQVHTWDTMHAQGRLRFQEILEKDKLIPDPATWIATMLKSEVLRNIMLESVFNHTERELLRPRWQEYIAWNPICRSFLELFLLAIRRHAIEHETAGSRNGPKWEDYYIGAFVGIADRFVTDDTRLRSALDQHRKYRGRVRWETVSLKEFLGDLHGGKLRSDGRQMLEVLPAQV